MVAREWFSKFQWQWAESHTLATDPANLRLLCPECNARKGVKSIN
ncbi:HNH endonuclease signature motif containing protein [Pseudocalidococcus azoricus]